MSKNVLVVEKMQVFHRRLKEKYHCRLTLLVEVSRLGAKDLEIYDRIIAVRNGADIQEWISLAKNANEIEKFDKVICLFDSYQIIAKSIAENIGIDILNKEAIEYVNDKYLMREQLCKEGVSNTTACIVKSKSEIKKIFNRNKYDLIVKPRYGRGSVNISKISSLKDIDRVDIDFEKNEYVAEKFFAGEEYSVESISFRGIHKVICVTKKMKYKDSFVESGHIVPANIEVNIFDEITAYVQKVLSALRVEDGVTHTEIMVNKGHIELIETHIRFGGDFIPEIVEESSGIDLIDYHCKISLGDAENDEFIYLEPLNKKNKRKYCAVIFKQLNKEGRIKGIRNLPTENKREGILRVEHEQIGDFVHKTSNSFNRGTMVMISEMEYKKCVDKAQKIINLVEYVYE